MVKLTIGDPSGSIEPRRNPSEELLRFCMKKRPNRGILTQVVQVCQSGLPDAQSGLPNAQSGLQDAQSDLPDDQSDLSDALIDI